MLYYKNKDYKKKSSKNYKKTIKPNKKSFYHKNKLFYHFFTLILKNIFYFCKIFIYKSPELPSKLS